MKTELSIMSRQDRSDAMWLADNWTSVQTQMKKLDISSSSASYLRQAIRKASATVQRSEAPDVVAVATVEPQVKPTATVQSEALNVVEKPVAATVEHSTLKPTVQESLDSEASPVVDTLEIIVDDAEAFADSVANLAKAEGLDLNAVIEALLKRV
jgi:hypothetical protein